MDYLPFALIPLILLIFILSMKPKYDDEEETHQRTIDELTSQIEMKIAQLNELNKQLDNRKINNNVQLSNIVNDILNIYDESNIRIPADIIEELAHMRLNDGKEVFDYIENQRLYWKLENMKKPHRKVK